MVRGRVTSESTVMCECEVFVVTVDYERIRDQKSDEAGKTTRSDKREKLMKRCKEVWMSKMDQSMKKSKVNNRQHRPLSLSPTPDLSCLICRRNHACSVQGEKRERKGVGVLKRRGLCQK